MNELSEKLNSFLKRNKISVEQLVPYANLSPVTLNKARRGVHISKNSWNKIFKAMGTVKPSNNIARHILIMGEIRLLARDPTVQRKIKETCPNITRWLFPNLK